MAVTEPKLRDLFSKALQCRTAEEEAAYLEQVCQGDAELRARLEELLQAHRQAGSFLQEPSPARPPTVDELSATEHNGGVEELDFLAASDKPDSLGRLGHYEVLEVIGRGGMGIVLRAFDDQLHRVVAIKVMAAQLATNATARRRFAREAQAAAAVSHDHIVTIHAVEESAPLPYLVMQYVAGLSLQQRLDRDGPLDLQEILRIGMQVASGLSAAHAQGLIHRDIKPANILLENGVERVKITDFGLARALTDASLTQSGVVAGTPQYMAPEQAAGKAVDQRTDLFSLGSVLYAMCTGRAPFRASGTMAVLKRVCEEKPTPIRESNAEIPECLVAIIDKLHAKDPAERYQSAAEVAELLGRHLAHVQHPSVVPLSSLAPEARGAGGEGRPHSRPRRRLAIAAAVFLCLLAGLTFTEATGVTNVRGTVIRIFTPDGTLVVQVDDPGVKVTIEGDGGLVITGAGLEEIRLRPGSYKVHADKDGKKILLERDVVSIAKNSREVVRVKVEAPPAPATVKAEKGAFVLLAAGKERNFNTLADAVQGASDGDTIGIRGNGPFVTQPISIKQALTIRAGEGFRPVIQLSAKAAEGDQPLFKASNRLVLEGLDLFRPKGTKTGTLVHSTGFVAAANCRFRVEGVAHCIWTADSWTTRNCVFLGGMGFGAMNGPIADGARYAMHNCVDIGTTPFNLPYQRSDTVNVAIRLTHNTIVGKGIGIQVGTMTDVLPGEKGPKPIRFDVSGNIFGSHLMRLQLTAAFLAKRKGFEPEKSGEALLRSLMDWNEHENLYAPGSPYLTWVMDQAPQPSKRFKTLAEWHHLWGLAGTGSLEGGAKYQGGDVLGKFATDPDRLTPDGFRLRPDSDGYRAGKDGKDLGADVDLVGPGPAYERWKKTPEYQQWLKDTNQVAKAEAPKEEPNAFVLLGGKGVEERKFDTLTEAVQRASDGDTIEIRGNGPFLSQPIDIQRTALTIRAGEGFRPVIQLSPEGVQRKLPLLSTSAALVLEGLELHHRAPSDAGNMVLQTQAPLWAANCRFRDGVAIDSPLCVFRNCESRYVGGWPRPGARWTFENCLLRAKGSALLPHYYDASLLDVAIQIKRSTVVSVLNLALDVPLPAPPDARQAAPPIRLDVSGSVFGGPYVLGFDLPQKSFDKGAAPQPAEAEATLLRLLKWQGERNIFAAGSTSVFAAQLGQHLLPGPKRLETWKRFWGGAETDSLEGGLRFQGGNLLSRMDADLDQLMPGDFRLRPDSAGYRAGKDGKDLGADVDLVGPGPAYESWKKTPEYQQWLKDVKQLK